MRYKFVNILQKRRCRGRCLHRPAGYDVRTVEKTDTPIPSIPRADVGIGPYEKTANVRIAPAGKPFFLKPKAHGRAVCF